jgi:hypothetical protein
MTSSGWPEVVRDAPDVIDVDRSDALEQWPERVPVNRALVFIYKGFVSVSCLYKKFLRKYLDNEVLKHEVVNAIIFDNAVEELVRLA